ncbi:unnamed protein product [Strongylus vulgaris]|uniref:Uncharacterized protein n=1 Tax=Strongylus vulgaris TaxID=40348 RepID=A0A3P7JJU1_STRVU|nr:unnamed protein product [Strongylus vulgaris]
MDDEDIIVIDDSICSPPTPARRSAPLREIEILDEPGPSTSGVSNKSVNPPLQPESYTSFDKLLELEQLIARAKANSVFALLRRSPKMILPVKEHDDDVAMMQEKIPNKLVEEEASEVLVKKKRKKEPSEAKLLKEREKKRKAIEREKNASVNTKCEQYMYCHVPRLIFDTFPETELNTRMEFLERNIQDQLICDEQRSNAQILWYRKCIDAEEKDDKIEKREYEVRFENKCYDFFTCTSYNEPFMFLLFENSSFSSRLDSPLSSFSLPTFSVI